MSYGHDGVRCSEMIAMTITLILPPRAIGRLDGQASLQRGRSTSSEGGRLGVEDKNAVACRVKDSRYWNREPVPASGTVSNTAFPRFSLSRYELETGIISSLTPFTTSVG